MKRAIETILFDFDYTLVESVSGVSKCINLALEALGFPTMDQSSICATIGLSLRNTFVSLVGEHHHAHADAFVQLFSDYADTLMVDHTIRCANVPFVAVLSGITKRESFAAYDSYATIDSIHDLPDLLLSSAPPAHLGSSVVLPTSLRSALYQA